MYIYTVPLGDSMFSITLCRIFAHAFLTSVLTCRTESGTSITFAPKVVEFPITYKTCETWVQVQVMTHAHIHAASYEMLASTNVHYYACIYT